MKKLIAVLAITISFSASSQKKDTTKPVAVDTVYIISKPHVQVLATVLRQSSLTVNGKQLTFDDVNALFNFFHEIYLPKEQPKEQPKK